MKRMKQKEWLAGKFCCPVCRGQNVESGDFFMPDEYERVCEDCGTVFLELYKAIGYKITKKGEDVWPF